MSHDRKANGKKLRSLQNKKGTVFMYGMEIRL